MPDRFAAPSTPVSAQVSRLRAGERETVEDLLRALLECEHAGEEATDARLAGMAAFSLETTLHGLARAKSAGLAEFAGNGWKLSPPGREIAVLVMRAHRLIETRLARESSLPAAEWHDVAHADEHHLTRDEINRLADRLDNPRFDPHGDPIPTREGRLPQPEGQPLLAWPVGEPAVVAHVEDEPPALFARLAAAGILAGVRLSVRTSDEGGCDVEVEGRTLHWPSELAALVRVRSLHADETPTPVRARRLSDLARGGAATVLTLLPACIGAERSRLLDLGFVPGSRIEHALQSPFGGPAAFRVRGTLIALRHEQAEQVLIEPLAS